MENPELKKVWWVCLTLFTLTSVHSIWQACQNQGSSFNTPYPQPQPSLRGLNTLKSKQFATLAIYSITILLCIIRAQKRHLESSAYIPAICSLYPQNCHNHIVRKGNSLQNPHPRIQQIGGSLSKKPSSLSHDIVLTKCHRYLRNAMGAFHMKNWCLQESLPFGELSPRRLVPQVSIAKRRIQWHRESQVFQPPN